MSTPKVKIAVTLSPELVERVRAAVSAGAARSLSAYVEHALSGQLAAETDFDTMIDEMLTTTGGPATGPERAEARRLLGGSAA